MKRIIAMIAAICCASAFGTTTVPVQLLNPMGSSAGLAIVSNGASSAPTWGGIGVNGIAAIAANTILANATGSSASPTAFAMPSCSTSNSALKYASGTGISCGTTFALTTGTLAQFASTTSAQLAGVISDETGTGALVFATNPALAGATSTATVTINAAGGGVIANDTAGASHANFYLQNSAANTWGIRSASTLSNAFQINRYVSGTLTDQPISIANTTGVVTMPDGLISSGQTSLGGTSGAEALRAVTTASAVNYLQVAGSTTTNPPLISTQGSDTNISLNVLSKGSGAIGFFTGGPSGVQQVGISHTAGANRYVTLTGSNGGNPTIGASAGNVGFSSAIAPSTTLGIIGTTAADNANAGAVGETQSAFTSSGVSMTSGTYANLTSVPLTAGDWDASGGVVCTGSSTTSYTAVVAGLNTVSNTSPAYPNNATFTSTNFGASSAVPVTLPMLRFNLASSATLYIGGQANFSGGSVSCQGYVIARRRR